MNYILLDDVPVISIFAGILTLVSIPIISFLFNKNLEQHKEAQRKSDEDNKEAHADFENAIENLQNAHNQLKLDILKDINSITVKLAEFKRDLTK